MLIRFKVVIEPEVEDGYSGYCIHVPALPGCASQGESIEEALTNIKEAIELYIETLKEDNLPLPNSDVDVELREVEISV